MNFSPDLSLYQLQSPASTELEQYAKKKKKKK